MEARDVLHLRIKSSRYLGLSALLLGCQEGPLDLQKLIDAKRNRWSSHLITEVRTTGQIHVGASGGVWAELDVTACEKKGGESGVRFFRGNREGRL